MVMEELVEWCRPLLAEFEIPRYFEVCAELPRTATNKIAKGQLRRSGGSGHGYDRKQAAGGPPRSIPELLRRRAASSSSSPGGDHPAYLFLADGEEAFQEIPHLHMHVFPRFEGDPFRIQADWQEATREELDRVAEQIRRVWR